MKYAVRFIYSWVVVPITDAQAEAARRRMDRYIFPDRRQAEAVRSRLEKEAPDGRPVPHSA